jgi:hypothetical protein
MPMPVVIAGIIKSIGILTMEIRRTIKFDVDKPWGCGL